jgi:hypothetical protein
MRDREYKYKDKKERKLINIQHTSKLKQRTHNRHTRCEKTAIIIVIINSTHLSRAFTSAFSSMSNDTVDE